jgi:hypothetical protein
MAAKVCCICESSCPDEHGYKIGDNVYYVCRLHYNIIKAMFEDFNKKNTPKPKKSGKSKK